jgi:hypothetical protein
MKMGCTRTTAQTMGLTRRCNHAMAPQRTRRAAPPPRASMLESIRRSLDVGRPSRLAAVNKLYTARNREDLDAALALNFSMGEQGFSRQFTRDGAAL